MSIPLEYIPIRRRLAIFRLDDREKRCAEPLALESDQFHQMVLRILVNEVVGAILSSLRNHPEDPTGCRLRTHIVELLEAIRALRNLLDLAATRPGDRSHPDHQSTEQCRDVDALVGQELVPFLRVK